MCVRTLTLLITTARGPALKPNRLIPIVAVKYLNIRCRYIIGSILLCIIKCLVSTSEARRTPLRTSNSKWALRSGEAGVYTHHKPMWCQLGVAAHSSLASYISDKKKDIDLECFPRPLLAVALSQLCNEWLVVESKIESPPGPSPKAITMYTQKIWTAVTIVRKRIQLKEGHFHAPCSR